MATTFEVVLPFGTPDALAVAEAAFDQLDELEAQLTVYRDTSEVSRLNRPRLAHGKPCRRRGTGACSTCLQTGGAHSRGDGRRLRRHGRGAHQGVGLLPGAAARAVRGRARGSTAARRHEARRAGRRRAQHGALPAAGLEINLGSIGKGYALDRLASLLSEAGEFARRVCCTAGTAACTLEGPLPATQRGWQVGIRHPWDADRRLATVWLRDRALGTSAATFQHLEYNGRKLGHVLDPRTGWPASGIASASVLAPTARRGRRPVHGVLRRRLELARRYCAAHPGVGAVLLPERRAQSRSSSASPRKRVPCRPADSAHELPSTRHDAAPLRPSSSCCAWPSAGTSPSRGGTRSTPRSSARPRRTGPSAARATSAKRPARCARAMRIPARRPRRRAAGPSDRAAAAGRPGSCQVPAQNRIPPALAKDWDDYFTRFADHYGLNDQQKKLAEAKLEQAKHNVVVWLTQDERRTVKKTLSDRRRGAQGGQSPSASPTTAPR